MPETTMFNILSVDRSRAQLIQDKIDKKIKPLGALGALEDLARQLALILTDDDEGLNSGGNIRINKPIMLVFAGDHGIANENISIAPSAVTQQMVLNFLNGGAAINCFCDSNNISIEVIDAGILLPIDDPRLTQKSLGRGTNSFIEQAAMSLEQVNRGIEYGKDVAKMHISAGSNVFGFGEMGIANTSSASAIQSLLMDLPLEQCVGLGTGITEKTLNKKTSLLKKAIAFHTNNSRNRITDPIKVMAAVGGFEIVQIVGAMLCVAESKRVILVDGYIVTAAALLAAKLYPQSRDYMIFCHQSNEQGHKKMLDALTGKPLLDLGLRLGEGTGAALALPLIRAAAKFYNDMSSFENAGVTDVVS